MTNNEKIKLKLINNGVIIDCPATVSIDETINPDRIAPGVTIYSGCRLSGTETSIGPGSILGAEAPVTLENCQLGHNVQLKGGYFSNATLLNNVTFGSGAHVREGTLMEEYASCAHTVGLKQTMLMPFVTLGSLINFCDCLMSGGTGRDNHSEVGSSYIHFNFTPHQDKATPSIMGNVPEGVMLNKPPVFLGGQGGIVGPARLAFGTILAAGIICRKDIINPDKLIFGYKKDGTKEKSYNLRIYGNITRIYQNNLNYIGNLHALYAWYKNIRPQLMDNDTYTEACIEGAKRQIATMIKERIKRLQQLADKVEISLKITKDKTTNKTIQKMQEDFIKHWPVTAGKLALSKQDDTKNLPEQLITDKSKAENYITSIQSLSPETKKQYTAWLQAIVEEITNIGD